MALLLILIGYYFDYKANSKTFVSDFKKGLLFSITFIFTSLILRFSFNINWIYIIFMIGIEIILIFSIKAFIQNKDD